MSDIRNRTSVGLGIAALSLGIAALSLRIAALSLRIAALSLRIAARRIAHYRGGLMVVDTRKIH